MYMLTVRLVYDSIHTNAYLRTHVHIHIYVHTCVCVLCRKTILEGEWDGAVVGSAAGQAQEQPTETKLAQRTSLNNITTKLVWKLALGSENEPLELVVNYAVVVHRPRVGSFGGKIAAHGGDF